MKRRLIVLRHAKSSQKSDAPDDHSRPLNGRGKRDAPRVAARIAELGWVFAVLFVLVAAVYALFLANAMDCLDEIDQGEWISFHTLKLNAMMGEIVGTKNR